MLPLPPLPKSELEIARIVWELGEATVREVVDALPEERDLDFFTVQTYLRRLHEKGFLKVRKQGRANVYLPKVRKTRVIQQMVDDFVQGVFGGDAIPLLQYLVKDRNLSLEQIDELQKTLDRFKEQKP